jgi:hypothetical protein
MLNPGRDSEDAKTDGPLPAPPYVMLGEAEKDPGRRGLWAASGYALSRKSGATEETRDGSGAP